MRLEGVDPGFHGKHETDEEAPGRARQGRRPPDRAAVPALRREASTRSSIVLQGIDAAGKDGTVLARDDGDEPAGHHRHRLQAADRGGARPRLPLARPPARPGPRPGRDLQPLALRGRAGRARARARAEGGLVEALRPDQRLREAAGRQRHHDPQVLPATSRPRSSSSASSSGSTTRRGSGRSATPTTRSAASGTPTSRPTRRCWRSARPTHAPWYVIPSNHKWFRNLAVSQILADTLDDLKMKMPKPTVDLDAIRREYHAAAARQ